MSEKMEEKKQQKKGEKKEKTDMNIRRCARIA